MLYPPFTTTDPTQGLSLFVARQLLGEFARGGGVLVGWQIDADLGAMRFDMAAEQVSQGQSVTAVLLSSTATTTTPHLTFPSPHRDPAVQAQDNISWPPFGRRQAVPLDEDGSVAAAPL